MKTVVHFTKGAHIVMEGMINQGFIYIVKSGEIVIDSKIQFINKKLNHYRAGDVFGFVSAILRKAHQDTLVAHTDCEIIKLTVDGFIEFMQSNPEIFKKFLTLNSEKLRTFLENIESYRDSDVDPESPEGLFEIGKKYIELNNTAIGLFALKKYITVDFSREKNPKYVTKAEDLLKQTNANYNFPQIEESFEGNIYPKGTVVFVENEPEDYFYIIAKGSIRISKYIDGKDFVLEVISEGEIFGEMAILNGKLRTATAIANEDSKLLRLNKENLLTNCNSAILTKLFHLLAKRFWLASQRFYIKQIDDPNMKLYLQLMTILEENLYKYPNLRAKNSVDLPITLEELKKMTSTTELDKILIKDFLTDHSLKFTKDGISIIDISDFEFKTGVMQKKYHRQFKDIYV
jgi:CRP-like cAMP-binding protein